MKDGKYKRNVLVSLIGRFSTLFDLGDSINDYFLHRLYADLEAELLLADGGYRPRKLRGDDTPQSKLGDDDE